MTVEAATARRCKTGYNQQENQPGFADLDRPAGAVVFRKRGITMHAGMVINPTQADVNRTLNWRERAMKAAAC